MVALNLQWFRQTPYMHGLGLGPLIGATVMTKRAWSKVPEGDREIVLAAARETEEWLEAEIPDQDQRAVEQMEKRGLKVVAAGSDAEWQASAEEFAGTMRQAIVPVEAFDKALAERDRFRQDRGEKGSP